MDGLGSWLGATGAVIQQIGLAVISAVFRPEGCRAYYEDPQVKQELVGRQGRRAN